MAQNQTTSPVAAVAPIQPSSKGSTAAPKLNNEMEMGSLPADGVPLGARDIMQLARVGDVPGMEKLFESQEYDATYTDDEGITPLHVSTSDADAHPSSPGQSALSSISRTTRPGHWAATGHA